MPGAGVKQDGGVMVVLCVCWLFEVGWTHMCVFIKIGGGGGVVKTTGPDSAASG